MTRFAGRTVVVTGASRGLGRAMAIAFGAEKARVFAGFRGRADDAAETVRLVREAGGEAEAAGFDVSKPAEVNAFFERIGAVDVLVNNAGRTADGPLALMDDAAWREVMATNLDGAFHCSRAALPAMIRSKRGAIVNVASVTGPRATPGQANYAASKGGLLALTRTMAAELAPKGIRVNAVVPGLIDAGIVQRTDRRIIEKHRALVPAGRLGRAEEVARAVLFLASDEASYVFGQELFVDGGLAL